MRQNKAYNFIFSVVALFFAGTAFGQRQMRFFKLDASQLPKGITFEGKVKEVIRWTDNEGDNIVLTTETGIYESNKFKHESEGADAELFAYHFNISKGAVKPTWKVYDFISDCPVDIEASFIKNALQVTDLDQDGTAEVWLMYKTACHGDVSPCDMKIIMYSGQQKFAMRGQNKVQMSENEFSGGEYKFDKKFLEAPKAFTDFAKKLWNKNIL